MRLFTRTQLMAGPSALRGVTRQSRCFASHTNVSHTAPLSRFEPDLKVDYADFLDRVQTTRDVHRRPLTYTEKILYSHLDDPETKVSRGNTQLRVRPRRVACQDATAQMALIQFMSAGFDATAVPTTVHCDHLIVGRSGKTEDLPYALDTHKEVYDFMASACQRYNMGFWKPGAGIIHQTVLENYAFPGGLMIGTDSHSPNAGGLGMIAIGVGGADAVDVMAGLPFEVKAPKIIGVHLTGQLSGWASPKDIINKLAGILTVKGGNGYVIEYFGPGVKTLSATGMSTCCNMGAETGATTSIFPYSPTISDYLVATHRSEMAHAARAVQHELQADEGAEYDKVVEIDLSSLGPLINGPYTPDLSTPISQFGEAVERNSWPELTAGLIGSCTNSSFEDMSRAASLGQQALDAGLRPQMPLLVSPGSEQTRATLERSGVLDVFEKLNSTMLTNACGPCAGSWDRQDVKKGVKNSVITSYNRNFTGRLDSNPSTNVFVASPEMVMAKIFSTKLSFDPTSDSLQTESGSEFRFTPPTGDSCPKGGYVKVDEVYEPPPDCDRSTIPILLSPESDRLQRLTPFAPWSGKDYEKCTILIKTKGKCTTDHITPAGPWLRYRGHLENISNNTLIGAVNAEADKVNTVVNQITGAKGQVPETARAYKAAEQPWVVIADHSYGEGSSREHAALQPRYLGGVAIIAKSFARIHEANLKKQGMLALTFADEADYDRIKSSDRISIRGLSLFAPSSEIWLEIEPTTGDSEPWMCKVNHTFTSEQIEYFRAGSALNLMASRSQS